MAAAGGAQQRGATLRIDRVHGQAELEQALHRLQVAGDRRRRQVRRLQRTARQRPAAPFQPVAEVAATGGERHAERGLAIGRARLRQGAGADQHAQRRLRGRARRRHGSAPWPRTSRAFGSTPCASRASDQALPAQADRQQQRRILPGQHAERVGAALEQGQRQLLGAARGVLAARAGGAGSAPGRRGRQPPGRDRAGAASGAGARRRARAAGTARCRRRRARCRRARRGGTASRSRQLVVFGKLHQQFGQQLRTECRRRVRASLRAASGWLALPAPRAAARAASCANFAVGEALGDVGRQRVVGIEHRDLRPAPVLDRDVDRAPALVVGALRIHAQRDQLAQQFRARRRPRQASISALRCCASTARDVRLGRRQPRDHRGVAVARGLEQRRHVRWRRARCDRRRRRAARRRLRRCRPAQACISAVRWPVPRESTRALCRSSSCAPPGIVVAGRPRPAAPAGRRPAPDARRVRSGSAPAASCPRRRRSPAG